MRDLYIVGAGGFGREVFGWLKDEASILGEWRFRGFLDDNPDALSGYDYPEGVVAPITGFQPNERTALVCGIGAVEMKRRLCQPLIDAGGRFLTVVHPSVILGANVRLGPGVVLCPRVTLTGDIDVGAMVMINCHSSAGHDVRIGAWSTISGHCDLTGNTRLGESVFVGSGVSVIPGKTVGDGAVLGAGSVVIRSVAEGAKVFGNPARVFG